MFVLQSLIATLLFLVKVTSTPIYIFRAFPPERSRARSHQTFRDLSSPGGVANCLQNIRKAHSISTSITVIAGEMWRPDLT